MSESTPQSMTEEPRRLRTFAGFAVVAALCLVAQGGGVASQSSAAAWEDRGLFSEQSHQVIALVVSLVTWALTVTLWLKARPRRVVRWLAVGASVVAAVLMLRSVFGKSHGHVPALSVFHAAAATAFLSFNVSIRVLLGRRWSEAPEGLGPQGMKPEPTYWLLCIAICLLACNFLQTIFGAIPRHTLRGDALHIVWAVVFLAFVLMASVRAFGRHGRLGGIVRPILLLFFLTTLEFFFGFATYVARPDTPNDVVSGSYEVTASLHQILGALMQVAAVVLVLRAVHLRRYVLGGVPTPNPGDVPDSESPTESPRAGG